MKVLAIDTATEACSVALSVGDQVVERWVKAPREHGDRLFPMVDELLAEAGVQASALDLIAFGRGPGAFTGVRIATGVAQGIAWSLDLPVTPVSTLVALAQGGWRTAGLRRILPAIDARMGEVYWTACEIDAAGVARTVLPESVQAPEQVALPEGCGWAGRGTGWVTYHDTLCARLGAHLDGMPVDALPHARDLLPAAYAAWTAGEAVSAAEALPVYLRDRVAEPPAHMR